MPQGKRASLSLAILLIAIPTQIARGQSEKRIACGVLIDNTMSLRKEFPIVAALGKGVGRYTVRRGPTKIYSFASQGVRMPAAVQAGSDWIQDENEIVNSVDAIYLQGGQTTLRDAIYEIAEALDTKVQADKDAFAGKVIVLITDGDDRLSKVKEEELTRKLSASGIRVYAVGLLDDLDKEGGSIRMSRRASAEDLLKRITKKTGGRVIFPKTGERNVDALVTDLFSQ
jgi:von Willebrand factor type A domain